MKQWSKKEKELVYRWLIQAYRSWVSFIRIDHRTEKLVRKNVATCLIPWHCKLYRFVHYVNQGLKIKSITAAANLPNIWTGRPLADRTLLALWKSVFSINQLNHPSICCWTLKTAFENKSLAALSCCFSILIDISLLWQESSWQYFETHKAVQRKHDHDKFCRQKCSVLNITPGIPEWEFWEPGSQILISKIVDLLDFGKLFLAYAK